MAAQPVHVENMPACVSHAYIKSMSLVCMHICTFVQKRFYTRTHTHTHISGNEHADSNADRGLRSHTSLGRFSTFPFLLLSSLLPHAPIQDIDLFTTLLVTKISPSTDLFSPRALPSPKPPVPSLSSSLFLQWNSNASATKHPAHLDKHWILSRLSEDHSGSPSDAGRPSKYQPRTQSVDLLDGTPCIESQNAKVLSEHLRDIVSS